MDVLRLLLLLREVGVLHGVHEGFVGAQTAFFVALFDEAADATPPAARTMTNSENEDVALLRSALRET